MRRVRAGFALPAVLTVIAIITLVFLVAIQALDSLAAETRNVRDEMRFRQAALTQEARAALLISLSPFTLNGVEIGGRRISSAEALGGGMAEDLSEAGEAPAVQRLALDGRIYGATGLLGQPVYVRLQDAAGQVNLNWLTHEQQRRLFLRLGVSPGDADMMADRMGDYLDPDDLRRPRGAEAQEYVRAGAQRPANASVIRVQEIQGVLGIREMVARPRWNELEPHLVADPTNALFNVNTASPLALAIMFDMDLARADGVIQRRRTEPFYSFEEFAGFAGVAPAGELDQSYILPNGRLTLMVIDPAAGLVYRSRLVMLPANPIRPVWVEDQSLTPLSPELRRLDYRDVERFPTPGA